MLAENKWERIDQSCEAERLYTKPRSFAGDVWFRFSHKPTALAGLIIIVFLLLFNIPNVFLHQWGLFKTYELGSGAVRRLYESGLMDKITLCCSIMGITMVGAMTGSLVSVTTALQFNIGDQVFKIQEILDNIMPNLLSLITVFILANVMKKEVNVVRVIFILMLIGILGAFIGIF